MNVRDQIRDALENAAACHICLACRPSVESALAALDGAVILSREQADTIEAALESARVDTDAPITDPYVFGLCAALALLREAKEATR